jgi:hypothetical protein
MAGNFEIEFEPPWGVRFLRLELAVHQGSGHKLAA